MGNQSIRQKISVIVNKRVEAEAFLEAMRECGFLPSDPIETHTPPESCYRMSEFRAKYAFSHVDVIVRCIEDIMPPADKEIPETSGSHSQQKAMLLPGYIRKDDPDLIISVSTAESSPSIQPEDTSKNGCVVIGGGFYTFDAHSFDPTSPSRLPAQEYRENNVPSEVYKLLTDSVKTEAVEKFCVPVHTPAQPMEILVGPRYISVAILNVVHYDAYKTADPAAYEACVKEHGSQYPAAIETTHGIVKACAGAIPTLFVSPITDRYKHFDDDDRDGQNRIASYNAGAAVSRWLREMDESFN